MLRHSQPHSTSSLRYPQHHGEKLDDNAANPELEDNNDSDDDSFDASSLVPQQSDHHQPYSDHDLTSERPSVPDTFLHSHQDHTRHIHHLNQLFPSPAIATTAQSHTSENNHIFGTTTSSSESNFENSRAIHSHRMLISSNSIPHTLQEETSAELRQDDFDTISYNSRNTDEDSGHISDEDSHSTIYVHQATRVDPNPTPRCTTRHLHSQNPATTVDDTDCQPVQDTTLEASDKQSPPASRESTPSSSHHNLEQNRRHAIAESIGRNPYSFSETWVASTGQQPRAHQADISHQHTTNGSFYDPIHNLTTATNSTQSRLSSFPSYFNSTIRPLGSTLGQRLKTSFSFSSQDTPPTTPLRGCPDSDDDAINLTKQKTHAFRNHLPSQTLQTSFSASNHITNSQLLHNQNSLSLDSTTSEESDRTPTVLSNPQPTSFDKTPSFISFTPNRAQVSSFKESAELPSQTDQQCSPSHLSSASTIIPPAQLLPASLPQARVSAFLPTTPFNRPPATYHPSWLTSLVKTPSKLQFSFVPSSPSSTTLSQSTQENSLNLAPHDPSSLLQKPSSSNPLHFTQSSGNNTSSLTLMANQSNLIATPQHIKRKRDFERTFLLSPAPNRDIKGLGVSTTPGEARIFHQSQQTTSILQGLNGQSYSHLQDQTFSLLTPNQSFGLEFSSPVGLRDWSIHHSPLPANDKSLPHHVSKALGDSCNIDVEIDRIEKSSSHTKCPPDADSRSIEPISKPNDPSGHLSGIKDESLFGPRQNQIGPLPNFSPFNVAEPSHDALDSQPQLQPKFDESPLAFRGKRHDSNAGDVNFLANSVLGSKSSDQPEHSTAIHFHDSDKLLQTSSQPLKIQVPNPFKFNHWRGLDHHEDANSSFDPNAGLSLTSMPDVSVYATPDASFGDELERVPHADVEDETHSPNRVQSPLGLQSHQNYLGQIQNQGTAPTYSENLIKRYQILLALAENLKQDLSIKNKLIDVLKTDREEAQRDRDEAEHKMQEIAEKLQDAVMRQNIQRNQQAQKISSIVQDLASELDQVMSKCDPTDSQGQFSFDEAHRLQTQMQSGKVAIEKFQQNLDSIRNSDAEGLGKLPEPNSSSDLLSPESKDALVKDLSAQAYDWQSRAKELETVIKKSTQTHSFEVRRLNIEIENLTQKFNAVSIQDQASEHLKENVRMLEEEAKTRMEALSEFRSQSHSLQQQLKVTKKSLELTERSKSEALNEIKQIRRELETISQKHFSDSQAQMAKLNETQNGFNAERTELVSNLKAKDDLIQQLKDELKRSELKSCKNCKSFQAQVKELEQERHCQGKKLLELKVQSANREVEMTRLTKSCDELKGDIAGLNMALQAKQQENSYLKRNQVLQQSGLNSVNLAASARTASNRASIRKANRTTAELTVVESNVGKFTNSTQNNIYHQDVRKSSLDNRPMLEPITNIARKRVLPNHSESVSFGPTHSKLTKSVTQKKPSIGSVGTATIKKKSLQVL